MFSTRTLLALAATLAALTCTLGVADAAEVPVVEHLTDGPGTDGDVDAAFGAVSATGTRLIFQTEESLAATDSDTDDDVYAREADGSLTHLTDDPTGPDSEDGADFQGATPDGTRVFFATSESLAATDTDSETDVYRRNADGTLTHISDSPTGPDAEEGAAFDSASDDGARVAFHTGESLAATDTDSQSDIYTRDADGGLTHVGDSTVGPDGSFGPGGAHVSADGARVIFNTFESLTATDTDTQQDIYAQNANGSLSHLTDDPTGPDAELGAQFVTASRDGTRVFFSTDESLAAGDTDATADVYRDIGGALVNVTDDPAGVDAEISAGVQGISADGTRAIVDTTESFGATDTDSENDLYRRNGDGSFDHLTDSPGADAEAQAAFEGASADGLRVFFVTDEGLTASDTDTAGDLYARNADGSLTHVSDDPTGADAEEAADFRGASTDGTRVFFDTDEGLADTDTDTTADLYARNADGTLTHLSDNPTGPDIAQSASFDASSADGTRVFFETPESLAATDTDATYDLYVARPPVPAGPGPGGGGGGGGDGGGGDTGLGTGAGTGTGTALGRDVVAPALTRLTAGPSAFRLGSLLPRLSRSAPVGTTLRFTLSEAARVTFTVQAKTAGRRVGRRCVKPARANRTRPRCTRLVTKGSFALNARQGADRVRFQGRLSATRRLAPGRYRLVLGAVDAAGNRSRGRTVDVIILPAKR
jgi:hypothetical protein